MKEKDQHMLEHQKRLQAEAALEKMMRLIKAGMTLDEAKQKVLES